MAGNNRLNFVLEFKSKGNKFIDQYRKELLALANSSKVLNDNLIKSKDSINQLDNALDKASSTLDKFDKKAGILKNLRNEIKELTKDLSGLSVKASSFDNASISIANPALELEKTNIQEQTKLKIAADKLAYAESVRLKNQELKEKIAADKAADKVVADSYKKAAKEQEDAKKEQIKLAKQQEAIEKKAANDLIKLQKQKQKEEKQAANEAKRTAKEKEKAAKDEQKAIEKVTKELKRQEELQKNSTKSLKKIALDSKAAIAGVVSTAAISAYTKGIFDYGVELDRFSQKSNIAISDFQAITDVAKQYGLSMENVADKFYDFNERIQEAATFNSGEGVEIFKALNIDIKEFQKLAPDKALRKLYDSMKDLNKGQQKQFLAALNIDDIEPIFRSFDQIDARLAELKKNGLAITDGEGFRKTKEDLNNLLNNIQAFSATVLQDVMPIIKSLTTDSDGNSILNGENAQKVADTLGKIAATMKVMYGFIVASVGEINIFSNKIANLSLNFSEDLATAINSCKVELDAFLSAIEKRGLKEIPNQVTDGLLGFFEEQLDKIQTFSTAFQGLNKLNNGNSIVSMMLGTSAEIAKDSKETTNAVRQAIGVINTEEKKQAVAEKKRLEEQAKARKESYKKTQNELDVQNKKQVADGLKIISEGSDALQKIQDGTYKEVVDKAKKSGTDAGNGFNNNFISGLSKNETIQKIVQNIDDEIEATKNLQALNKIDNEQAKERLNNLYNAKILYQDNYKEAFKQNDALKSQLDKTNDIKSALAFESDAQKEKTRLLDLQIELLEAQGKTEEANKLKNQKAIAQISKDYTDAQNQIEARSLQLNLINIDNAKNEIARLNDSIQTIDLKFELNKVSKDAAIAQINDIYDKLEEQAKIIGNQNQLLQLQVDRRNKIKEITQSQTDLEKNAETILSKRIQLLEQEGKLVEANELKRQQEISNINRSIDDLGQKADLIDLTNKLFDRDKATARLQEIESELDKLENKLSTTNYISDDRVKLENDINSKIKERVDLQKQLGQTQTDYNESLGFSVQKVYDMNKQINDEIVDSVSNVISRNEEASESFSQLFKNIIKGFAEVQIRQGLLTGLGFLTGTNAKQVQSGKAGAASSLLNLFASASGYFHTGSGPDGIQSGVQIPGVTKSDEFAIIAKRGEQITTKNQSFNQDRNNSLTSSTDITLLFDSEKGAKSILQTKTAEKTMIDMLRKNKTTIKNIIKD